MSQIAKLSLPLLLFGAAVVGCSQSEEPIADTAAEVTSAAPTAAPDAPPVAQTSETPDLAGPETNSAQVAEFTPPFPERSELFEPPQRSQDSVQRGTDEGETVELVGFINVDQPLAVMSIDGVISPIPEGGEKYGVQVITIEPPTVLWQRGRVRRTATLE